MREILFRGKRTDNGEWVEGYVGAAFTIDENGKVKSREFTALDCLGCSSQVIVSDETIGQYTGLTDKNGRKIFTGDIVKYQFDNDDCPFPNKRTDKIIGRIFFSDFRASFSVTAGKNGSSSMNNDLFKYVRNGNRVEVIGNIHDNPELLKGGTNEQKTDN